MRDKFTIGVDGGASAGPIARDTKADIGLLMTAEIPPYSRSRGISAGVALDGAIMRTDKDENAGVYLYSGAVPSGRPADDYTLRAIPRCREALIPLELPLITWQK